MFGMLLLTLFAIGSFAVAIYSQMPHEPIATLPSTPAAAAVALAPSAVPIALEGTVVMGETPAANAEPFILYADGNDVKTKRLVFRDAYACAAGDIPCSFESGERHPLRAGYRIRVGGIADADVIYVDRLDIASRATLES